jgi:hypothetical protein
VNLSQHPLRLTIRLTSLKVGFSERVVRGIAESSVFGNQVTRVSVGRSDGNDLEWPRTSDILPSIWSPTVRPTLLNFIFIALTSMLAAQQPALTHVETVQELRDRLSPGPRQELDQALTAFQSQRYADALNLIKQLRERHPNDTVLIKFAAEAELNTGDPATAMATIRPVADATPTDWQAVNLVVRACAESGDTACRDTQLAHLVDLHRQGVSPPNLLEYPVERIKSGVNTLTVLTAVEPVGPYKLYARGRVTNREGKLFLTISLESNDVDQPAFAKQHPKEAGAGGRRFSIDAYAETGLNQAGQRTQTHYTFKFIDGLPPYDTIRSEFMDIASGKSHPLSSRTGLIVP